MATLICTLTFKDEGYALRAAANLKHAVHSRGGRMNLDENPIRSKRHDILIYASTPDKLPTLEKFCMNYSWSDLDGLLDMEPAELPTL